LKNGRPKDSIYLTMKGSKGVGKGGQLQGENQEELMWRDERVQKRNFGKQASETAKVLLNSFVNRLKTTQ